MRSREINPRPSFGRPKRQRFQASLERMEPRQLLTTYFVNTTADYAGPATDPVTHTPLVSLRYAITLSNQSATPGSNNIDFAIPAAASVNPNLTQPHDVAFPGLDPTTGNELFPGFDPSTQDWTIALKSPLPAITHQVTIDGYTQGQNGVPFNYPNESQYQTLALSGNPSGGTFTLSTSAPLPVGTTVPIAYNASAATVQQALQAIVGTDAGNVSVTGSTQLPSGAYNIYFRGDYDGQNIQPLTATSSLFGTGTSIPAVSITEVQPSAPTLITSAPSTIAAKDGNNATPRIIVEGGAITSLTGIVNPTGFNIQSSDTNLRGLIIDGFGVGVSVQAGYLGDVIQGNDIGQYPVFFVDTQSGDAETGAGSIGLGGQGNSLQGLLLASTNATGGGVETQDANVIIGNGEQGVDVLAGAHGNQIVGNQIGVAGPFSSGSSGSSGSSNFYIVDGNGSDGVLIADSSNFVGGLASGAGNLISGNHGDGVHLLGTAAFQNVVQANYIGVGPGGGFLLGTTYPGNLGDGVTIENAHNNQIGGSTSAAGNVISANGGAGVRIFDNSGGTSATGNNVQGNIIGLTSDAISVLGNAEQGVAIYAARNTVDDTNIISANLLGVLLSGAGATGNLVNGNFIGTDGTGAADLGNATEGVEILSASNNTISGNAKGSQVISGNNVGLLITGNTATKNLILGNFIGTDTSGTLALGNSLQGIEINGSPDNTVGNGTAAGLNLISANHTGVEIIGGQATGNVLQGNEIGTDITGKLPLGNEVDGVYIHQDASANTVGGSTASDGNTIAFNGRDGVRIEDNSVGNAILSNSIFANGEQGINLVPGTTPPTQPNNLQNAPVLTSVATSISSTIITGTLTSLPDKTYTIQFFGSATQDPTGTGEGGQFLGQTTVITGPTGQASFSANVPTLLNSGQYVTATATDSSGDTSVFSNAVTQVFGTVQFAMTSYTVNEGVGTATITATRMGGSGGYFTVGYSTADGTATAGTDYQTASGTLTFNPGVDSQSFTVTVDDNGLPSADKTVLLKLSNPTGPITLGAQSSATLTIQGNQPGAIQFQMASYVVDEAAGTATITVTRQTIGTTTSINYSTAGGSAISGVDYVPTSGTLTFSASQFSQTFTVPILINPQIPGNVTVNLVLSSPTNGSTLGDQSSAVLTIQPAVIQFQMTGYTVGEAGGTAIITVSRSSTVGTATVNYFTSNGSAIPGVDYLPTYGTVTFNPGQLVEAFTVPILIDPLIKGNPTINLNLSSPVGGVLGSASTASLTILNDGVDRQGPHVTSVKAVSGPLGTSELVVAFDEALNPTTAVNLLNYGYSVRTPGKDGKLGTKDDRLIGIRSATYDPTTFTVTLSLATAVKNGSPLELMLNAATNVATAGVGISDLAGNLLDGDHNGYPGGSYTAKVVAEPAPTPVQVTASKTVSHKAKAVKHKVNVSSVKSHPGGPAMKAASAKRD